MFTRYTAHSAFLAENFAKVLFPMERREFVEIQGQAHRLGFSSPYLRGCLHVYAGGEKFNNPHIPKYLHQLGLLSAQSELTLTGKKMLAYFEAHDTAKVGLGFQELADPKKVQQALKASSGYRAFLGS